jgi:iron complex outermembrane receptor protein
VVDQKTFEPLIGAEISYQDSLIISGLSGEFLFPYRGGGLLTVNYLGYEDVDLIIEKERDELIIIEMLTTSSFLETVVVSESRITKKISDASVAVEVIQPDLIKSQQTTNISDILAKTTGVQIVDGQANIRGGAGFSYGAGSRVILLLDDIPALQGDAASPNWSDMPVEFIDRVEVVKGAASTLYGSSALNGVINIHTEEARTEPRTGITAHYGVIGTPADTSKQWWDKSPTSFIVSAFHSRKVKSLDFAIGGKIEDSNEHNQFTYRKSKRVFGKIKYRVGDKLTFGVNTLINTGENSNFFFWKNNTTGAFTADSAQVSINNSRRFFIDPKAVFYHNPLWKSTFKGRFHHAENNANNNRQNGANTLYGEYQIQRHNPVTKNGLTLGMMANTVSVKAELYGDTLLRQWNMAPYAQYEMQVLPGLLLSVGGRWEHFKLNGENGFSGIDSEDGPLNDSRFVFRGGLNYNPLPYSTIRFSAGQGYRYPSIAERFISTDLSVIRISPNPQLQPETGWHIESGVRQGMKIGQFQGFVDLSVFYSEYDDMMEFIFKDFITGFQSQNIGATKIFGIEPSIGLTMNSGDFNLSLFAGYTWINPQFRSFTDSLPIQIQSSVDYNILKYRRKHDAKFQLSSGYKGVSISIGHMYASHMEAVDAAFELFLPGVLDYRKENDKGYHVTDLSMSYQWRKYTVRAGIFNLFNSEYSIRPGLLDSPRNFRFTIGVEL